MVTEKIKVKKNLELFGVRDIVTVKARHIARLGHGYSSS